MNDLSQLLEKIQASETSHTDMAKRMATGTLQWYLEQKEDLDAHPIYNRNKLEFLICSEGFLRIAGDIEAATSSIDLVCWGFDPGMELVRGAQDARTRWPRNITYGDLLTAKARAGVQVRLLLWYPGDFLNWLTDIAPDVPALWRVSSVAQTELQAPTLTNASDAEIQKARAGYCRAWWKTALGGGFKGVEVRTRKLDMGDAWGNTAKYLPERQSLSEEFGRTVIATHHQKTVLIDYETKPGSTPATQEPSGFPGGPNPCGYVMGLNAVTDYWDTSEHKFNDPLREANWDAGSNDTNRWSRKPYRDYAIRVEGEALHNVNQNFVQGWDGAHAVVSTSADGLAKKRGAIRPEDIHVRSASSSASQRAQIVRTYPSARDASILKAYTLATSNAVNYIYVENQYFQFAEWPQLIKNTRQQYCKGMKQARLGRDSIEPLYLFVVIPQAERDEMVPRTYDTVAQLVDGHESMGEYDKQVQGVRTGADASGSTRDSVDAVPANPQDELDALAIKPLVAMLMTYDHADEAKKIRIRRRDNTAQEAQAKQEKERLGHSSDEEVGNTSKSNIIPKRYREIYIHSKLMFVDDVYTTVGSANLNVRSMVSDSEINICTEEHLFTQTARQRVWGNLAGEDLNGKEGTRNAMKMTFNAWSDRMNANKDHRAAEKKGTPPINGSFIHPFEDSRAAPWTRLG